jgi:hypothetical protein
LRDVVAELEAAGHVTSEGMCYGPAADRYGTRDTFGCNAQVSRAHARATGISINEAP